MFKNFRGYMAQLLHGKTVVCSVYSKILRQYKKRLLQKILFFRCIRSQKIFLRRIRKTPVPDSLFDEVAGFHSAALLKKRPRNRCFPVIFTKVL